MVHLDPPSVKYHWGLMVNTLEISDQPSWDSHLRNGASWHWQWECIHGLIVAIKASKISLLMMNSGKFIAYSSSKKLFMCAKFTQHGGSRSFSTYWRPWKWFPFSKTGSFTDDELPLAVHAEKTKLTLLRFVLQIYSLQKLEQRAARHD